MGGRVTGAARHVNQLTPARGALWPGMVCLGFWSPYSIAKLYATWDESVLIEPQTLVMKDWIK